MLSLALFGDGCGNHQRNDHQDCRAAKSVAKAGRYFATGQDGEQQGGKEGGSDVFHDTIFKRDVSGV